MNRSISTRYPIGRLTIVEATEAIVAIRWADDGDNEAPPLLAEACRPLRGYSGGAGLETKRALLALEAAAKRWEVASIGLLKLRGFPGWREVFRVLPEEHPIDLDGGMRAS